MAGLLGGSACVGPLFMHGQSVHGGLGMSAMYGEARPAGYAWRGLSVRGPVPAWPEHGRS